MFFKTGGYWAEELEPREHCYKAVPFEEYKPKFVSNVDWEELYNRLGELGYRFQDAGHCSEYILISLNRVLEWEDRMKIWPDFTFFENSGDELGFV